MGAALRCLSLQNCKSNKLPSFILVTITEKKTETEATVSRCLTTTRLAQI